MVVDGTVHPVHWALGEGSLVNLSEAYRSVLVSLSQRNGLGSKGLWPPFLYPPWETREAKHDPTEDPQEGHEANRSDHMVTRPWGSSSFISFHHTISSLGSGSRLLLYVSRRSPVRRIYIMSTNILSSFVSLLTPSSIRFHSGRLWLTLFHRQKGTERSVSLPSLSIINSGHMEPRAQHEGDGTTVEAWKVVGFLRSHPISLTKRQRSEGSWDGVSERSHFSFYIHYPPEASEATVREVSGLVWSTSERKV